MMNYQPDPSSEGVWSRGPLASFLFAQVHLLANLDLPPAFDETLDLHVQK